MPESHSGKPLALVTGASAGIGAEFARQLAARNHDLVLTARRQDRLDNLAEELESRYSCQCLTLSADLKSPDAPEAIVTRLEQADLQVDLLVNNAGYAVPGYFTGQDWTAHRDFLQVMVNAVSELSWRLLPGMQQRGRGGIINVASLAGLVPGSSGHTLYAAVKAWMVAFSESLAMENQESGLRIQALCPGFTYSEFHDVVGTRDIVSQMPDYMWMSAADVVRISLDQYDTPRSPVIVVPGRFNRFIAMLARKLPYPTAFGMVKKRAGRFRRRE